jgi:serine/threonine protein kinase
VTDVVGIRLSSRLAKGKLSEGDLIALTKRLALALAAAHGAGVIHRGLRPHAIALPQGRLSDATIVDFNLIKSAHTGTSASFDDAMVDHDFCAPEQSSKSGEGAVIGPWTDVYSLALVILSAQSDAARKANPDLSLLPARLRPVFERMLEPKAARRLQSMDDVVKQIDIALGPEPRKSLLDHARAIDGGTARRAAVAAGALLIAASPWIIQTSLPSGPADASTVPPAAKVQTVSAPAPAAPVVAPVPEGRVYGADNANSRITLRFHRAARVSVHSRGQRLLFSRAIEAGDSYRAPSLSNLTVTTEDAGAVEVLFDGTSAGFVGRDGEMVEKTPLARLASVAPRPPVQPSQTAAAPSAPVLTQDQAEAVTRGLAALEEDLKQQDDPPTEQQAPIEVASAPEPVLPEPPGSVEVTPVVFFIPLPEQIVLPPEPEPEGRRPLLGRLLPRLFGPNQD